MKEILVLIWFSECFSNLPAPKSAVLAPIEEVEDDFLKKTVSLTEVNNQNKTKTVKISIPSLTELDSDEEVQKKKFKSAADTVSFSLICQECHYKN